MVPAPNIEAIVERTGVETAVYWLRMLRTLPRSEIGVVKAGGKLLSETWLPQLAAELACLAAPHLAKINSETGFYLPVVIGGGVDYDKLPAYKESDKVNGLRITSDELIGQMLPIALKNQRRVVSALRTAGVDAIDIPLDAVHVKSHGLEHDQATNQDISLGYVGDVVSIDKGQITAAIDRHQIPVLSHLGFCPTDGRLYNLNADTLAAQLVKALDARKLIMVSDTAVQDGQELVRTFFSRQQFDDMVADGRITGGMVLKLQEAYALLETLGPDHSVQITTLKYENGEKPSGERGLASTGLLEELLGDGSGTKLMIPSPVDPYHLPLALFDIFNLEILRDLVNAAFMKQQGKKLIDDYFAYLRNKSPTIYLDAANRGVAITYPLPTVDGCEYLCKLATKPDYEGIGVAASIMEKVIIDKNSVAWRSSKPSRLYDNIIHHYAGFKEETGEYTVYGVGIPDDKKQDVIRWVISIPATLQKVEGTP